MTGSFHPFRFGSCLAAAASVAMLATVPPALGDDAKDAPRAYACAAPADITRLPIPLTRTAQRLAAGKPLTIVAIGSSSTAGAGATAPSQAYPSRLAAELARLFPDSRISVLNRGVNGEEAHDMLARFERGVIAEKPDLVLWQVGTNAVLRDHPLRPAATLIHEGLTRLKASGADVILVDPQFAPKVLAKDDADDMVDLIALAAKKENVNLFRRFAVMRHWRQSQGIPFGIFLSPDELHMNDWSYACIARLLAGGIAEAVTRATQTAGIPPRR